MKFINDRSLPYTQNERQNLEFDCKKCYLFMTVFVDKLKYKAPLAAGRFDSKQVCQEFHKTKVW